MANRRSAFNNQVKMLTALTPPVKDGAARLKNIFIFLLTKTENKDKVKIHIRVAAPPNRGQKGRW
jgi:hypothetical protein